MGAGVLLYKNVIDMQMLLQQGHWAWAQGAEPPTSNAAERGPAGTRVRTGRNTRRGAHVYACVTPASMYKCVCTCVNAYGRRAGSACRTWKRDAGRRWLRAKVRGALHASERKLHLCRVCMCYTLLLPARRPCAAHMALRPGPWLQKPRQRARAAAKHLSCSAGPRALRMSCSMRQMSASGV